MSGWLIVRFWRHGWSAIAALATAIAVFLWPAVPLAGLENWIAVLAGTPYLAILYPIIAMLSGVLVGLVVYHKTAVTHCEIGSAKVGAAGSAMGIVFGACPACIPVVALFLPLAFNLFLSRVAPYMSVAAIAVMLYAVYRLHGFRSAGRAVAKRHGGQLASISGDPNP